MTFTRLSDSSVMNPETVEFPVEQSRETGTVARRVGQSSEVRVTYVGATAPRTGTFRLRFATYASAEAAAVFFSAKSLFEFDGTTSDAGTYTIVDDLIVETADVDEGDYAIRFTVVGEIQPTAEEDWTLLRVQYMEVPA